MPASAPTTASLTRGWRPALHCCKNSRRQASKAKFLVDQLVGYGWRLRRISVADAELISTHSEPTLDDLIEIDVPKAQGTAARAIMNPSTERHLYLLCPYETDALNKFLRTMRQIHAI